MSTDESSTRILAVTVSIFFFTTQLSQMFLSIYFIEEVGMSVPEVLVILFFMFLVIGLFPTFLIRTTRHFERIFSLGILLTLLFYVALIYVKNPVILGLAYGLSIATFWPSFNLLQFRLTETKERAFLMSLLSHVIPSLTGIIGPAVGGFIIETYDFTILFAASIILYFASFTASMKIRFKSESQKFLLPKSAMFKIFMITFILMGLSESYWFAYPLFVFSISSTYISMGFVVATGSFIIALANLAINKLSDIKKARVEFAILSLILHAAWYFALTQVTNMIEIVLLSLLSGLSGACIVSWFAYYGDSFSREYHASILVMMEVALMIGRIINLIPTYYFLTEYDYSRFFIVLGLISLLSIPFYILSRKRGSNKAGLS